MRCIMQRVLLLRFIVFCSRTSIEGRRGFLICGVGNIFVFFRTCLFCRAAYRLGWAVSSVIYWSYRFLLFFWASHAMIYLPLNCWVVLIFLSWWLASGDRLRCFAGSGHRVFCRGCLWEICVHFCVVFDGRGTSVWVNRWCLVTGCVWSFYGCWSIFVGWGLRRGCSRVVVLHWCGRCWWRVFILCEEDSFSS